MKAGKPLRKGLHQSGSPEASVGELNLSAPQSLSPRLSLGHHTGEPWMRGFFLRHLEFAREEWHSDSRSLPLIPEYESQGCKG